MMHGWRLWSEWGPSLVPESQSRLADVFIENWIDGGEVAFDVSVFSRTQDAVLLQLKPLKTPASAIKMPRASMIRAHFDANRTRGVYRRDFRRLENIRRQTS